MQFYVKLRCVKHPAYDANENVLPPIADCEECRLLWKNNPIGIRLYQSEYELIPKVNVVLNAYASQHICVDSQNRSGTKATCAVCLNYAKTSDGWDGQT